MHPPLGDPDPADGRAGPADGRTIDVRKARRIEFGVYVFTALSLITLGVFLTSKILNWIVGPAYVVTMVCLVTPLVLKLAGVADPDAGSLERWKASPEGRASIARGEAKAARKAGRAGGAPQ